MASTTATGSADGGNLKSSPTTIPPVLGIRLKRLLLRYDPPALGAEFIDSNGQEIVRRVALPDLREQNIDLGDLAAQIVETEPDIDIRHKPMVFKILLRLEQELRMKRRNFFNFSNIADKFRSKPQNQTSIMPSVAGATNIPVKVTRDDGLDILKDISSRGSTPQPISPISGKDGKKKHPLSRLSLNLHDSIMKAAKPASASPRVAGILSDVASSRAGDRREQNFDFFDSSRAGETRAMLSRHSTPCSSVGRLSTGFSKFGSRPVSRSTSFRGGDNQLEQLLEDEPTLAYQHHSKSQADLSRTTAMRWTTLKNEYETPPTTPSQIKLIARPMAGMLLKLRGATYRPKFKRNITHESEDGTSVSGASIYSPKEGATPTSNSSFLNNKHFGARAMSVPRLHQQSPSHDASQPKHRPPKPVGADGKYGRLDPLPVIPAGRESSATSLTTSDEGATGTGSGDMSKIYLSKTEPDSPVIVRSPISPRSPMSSAKGRGKGASLRRRHSFAGVVRPQASGYHGATALDFTMPTIVGSKSDDETDAEGSKFISPRAPDKPPPSNRPRRHSVVGSEVIQYEDQHSAEDPDLEKLMPHLKRKRLEKRREEREIKAEALALTERAFETAAIFLLEEAESRAVKPKGGKRTVFRHDLVWNIPDEN